MDILRNAPLEFANAIFLVALRRKQIQFKNFDIRVFVAERERVYARTANYILNLSRTGKELNAIFGEATPRKYNREEVFPVEIFDRIF